MLVDINVEGEPFRSDVTVNRSFLLSLLQILVLKVFRLVFTLPKLVVTIAWDACDFNRLAQFGLLGPFLRHRCVANIIHMKRSRFPS
jgi:hypothetical protein